LGRDLGAVLLVLLAATGEELGMRH
jgi:hypothetical protein